MDNLEKKTAQEVPDQEQSNDLNGIKGELIYNLNIAEHLISTIIGIVRDNL